MTVLCLLGLNGTKARFFISQKQKIAHSIRNFYGLDSTQIQEIYFLKF